jgi:transaldolase
MKKIEDLRIKIFCDGASSADFKELGKLPYIKGFTTNPSLMKKAGVTDYERFLKEIMPHTGGKPVSFEVIGDDFASMKDQALRLRTYGENVYVKIPITNTSSEPSQPLIAELLRAGVRLNITAITDLAQVEDLAGALVGVTPCIVSIFAGRIADTGIDPVPVMKKAKKALRRSPHVELLWASTRELLNIFQAEEAECDIITVLPDILKKLHLVGYDLKRCSLDTVKMFYNDGVSSGLKL